MKIYKRKIVASNVFGKTVEIIHDFDYILQDNKHLILQMLDQYCKEHVPDEFREMYAPYLKVSNLEFKVNDVGYDHQNFIDRFIVRAFLKVPLEITMLYYLAIENYQYSSYIDYVGLYLEEAGLASVTTYQNVFWCAMYKYENITEEEMKNNLIKELKDDNNYRLLYNDRYYDSNLNHEYLPISEFLEWVKPKVKKPRTSGYNKMIAQLQSERDAGINSIYEQTEAGSYIDNIVQTIEDSLGIWSEPSIQGGHGSIIFRDNDTDEVLLENDYEEYCDDIIDMALQSKSKKEFISQLKQYYDI